MNLAMEMFPDVPWRGLRLHGLSPQLLRHRTVYYFACAESQLPGATVVQSIECYFAVPTESMCLILVSQSVRYYDHDIKYIYVGKTKQTT